MGDQLRCGQFILSEFHRAGINEEQFTKFVAVILKIRVECTQTALIVIGASYKF